jgi:hypothetical protein
MLAGDSETAPAHPGLLRSEFVVISICAASLLVLGIRVPGVLTKLIHVGAAVLQ